MSNQRPVILSRSSFKRWPSFFVCLFSLALVSAAPRLASADARSVAVNPTVDFGTIREGESVQTELQIRNDGDAPLQIQKIQTSCGCTTVAPTATTIAPGSTLALATTFHTAGFAGAKLKTVRVYTNDPRRSSLLFSLRATVDPTIRVEPSRLFWGEVLQGAGAKHRIEVSVANTSDVQITGVTSRSPLFEVSTQPFSEKGRHGIRGTIELLPSAPVGPIQGSISITTSSTNEPEVQLYNFGNVVGDIRLNMSDISFGLLHGPLTAPKQAVLKLSSRTGKRVILHSVECDTSGVSAESREVAGGKEHELFVAIAEGMLGTIRAKLKISYSLEGQAEPQELIVPVYAVIARQGE